MTCCVTSCAVDANGDTWTVVSDPTGVTPPVYLDPSGTPGTPVAPLSACGDVAATCCVLTNCAKDTVTGVHYQVIVRVIDGVPQAPVVYDMDGNIATPPNPLGPCIIESFINP